MNSGDEMILALLILLLVAFVALTGFVMRRKESLGELEITRRIQKVNLPGLRPLLRLISLPGYPPQVFIIGVLLVIVPFLLGWRWIAFMQAFTGFGVGLASTLVKNLVHRARPTAEHVTVHRLLDGGGLSYPAGHCADYLSRFGFIIYLLISTAPATAWVWLLIALLTIFIALVGLSRIDSGEHWLTDVLGGYLLGGIWFLVTLYVYNWGQAQRLLAVR